MKTVLTDDEIEQARVSVTKSFRHHISSVRGQMVTELDDPEYHVIRAIEAAVLAKFGEPVAWRGMTGHGAVISVNPPAIQPDNWTPLYALKDKP